MNIKELVSTLKFIDTNCPRMTACHLCSLKRNFCFDVVDAMYQIKCINFQETGSVAYIAKQSLNFIKHTIDESFLCNIGVISSDSSLTIRHIEDVVKCIKYNKVCNDSR